MRPFSRLLWPPLRDLGEARSGKNAGAASPLVALILAGGAASACLSGGAGPGASATIDAAAATESPWSPKCEAIPRQDAPDPTSELTIVSELGAAACGFDTTRLAAWAGKPMTIEYVDRDPTLVHNFAIYLDPDRTEVVVARTAWLLAPQRETLELKGLEAGTYYFYCDLHTRTMFGTLTTVDPVP